MQSLLASSFSSQLAVTPDNARAPFRPGDFLTYIPYDHAGADQYTIAVVGGNRRICRGMPEDAECIGVVTGVWTPH